MTVTQTNDEPLLHRKKISLEVNFQAAVPSRMQLKTAVAKKQGAKENVVIVREFDTHFGDKKASVTAYVYENADSLNKIERKHMIKRNTAKEKKEEKKQENTEAKAEETKTENKESEEKQSESKPEKKAEKAEEAPKE